jgi:molybdopterin-containing oxidoreductase family iron-sulfur binding subunit
MSLRVFRVKTLMGRGDIIRDIFRDINQGCEVLNEVPMVSLNHEEVEATKVDLWTSFDQGIILICRLT